MKYILMFLLIAGVVFGERVGILDQVMRPEMIRVSDQEIFIIEGAKVFRYSLPGLKLINTIGAQGEGPGETKNVNIWHNTICLEAEWVFLDGFDKVIYFKRDGALIREKRKSVGTFQSRPLGDRFIVSDLTYEEEKRQYQLLKLAGPEFKEVRKIYKQLSPVQVGEKTSYIIPDILYYDIWDGKVFIEKSAEGFVIDVYDASGKKLYRIARDEDKLPVTEVDRKAAEELFKQDVFVKEIGYDNFRKNISTPIFPEYFPPIKGLDVDSGKIYVRTFKKRNGKEQCIVMDLKGKQLAETYLSPVGNAPFMAHLIGIRYYTFHKGKFYFIAENEDQEQWELFVENVK